MKKLWMLLLTCMLIACASVAGALTLDEIYAKIELPDTYTILTPDNLTAHAAWVQQQGSNPDELATMWRDSGILVVGVPADNATRIIISAVKDSDAALYFDIDQQTTKVRTAYRNSYLKHDSSTDGYSYSSVVWKKTTRYGRFLQLKYHYALGTEDYRGYAMRTIRNGYTITVDYQVYGRTLKAKDLTALTDLMKSFSFTQVLTKPVDTASNLTVTEAPPSETNTGVFTVSGKGDTGIRVIAVAMRMSSSDKLVKETVVSKKGSWSIDFKLPYEGTWLVTLNAYSGEEAIMEDLVFDTTTYSATLLPVTITSEIPSVVTTGEMTITGYTVKNVTVQCLVGDDYSKSVKTNASGKFSFTFSLPNEGDYDIVLAFQKKGLNSVRKTYHITREISEEEWKAGIRKSAIKPAYSTLTDKLKGYTGRVMGYSLYVADIQQAGSEYVVKMAMKQTKTALKNFVYVTCEEDPGFEIGSKHKFYATCIGSFTVETDEGSTSYPGFELLFWDD